MIVEVPGTNGLLVAAGKQSVSVSKHLCSSTPRGNCKVSYSLHATGPCDPTRQPGCMAQVPIDPLRRVCRDSAQGSKPLWRNVLPDRDLILPGRSSLLAWIERSRAMHKSDHAVLVMERLQPSSFQLQISGFASDCLLPPVLIR